MPSTILYAYEATNILRTGNVRVSKPVFLISVIFLMNTVVKFLSKMWSIFVLSLGVTADYVGHKGGFPHLGGRGVQRRKLSP